MSRFESDDLFSPPIFRQSSSFTDPTSELLWVGECSGKRRKTGHRVGGPQSPVATGEVGLVMVGDAPQEQKSTSIESIRLFAPLRWQPGAVPSIRPSYTPPKVQMLVGPHTPDGHIIRFICTDSPQRPPASPRPGNAHQGTVARADVPPPSSGSETEPRALSPQSDSIIAPTSQVRPASPPALSPIDSCRLPESPPATASHRQAIRTEPEQLHPVVSPTVSPTHTVKREGSQGAACPTAQAVGSGTQFTSRELGGLAPDTTVIPSKKASAHHIAPKFWSRLTALNDVLLAYATCLSFEGAGASPTSLLLVTSQPLSVTPSAGDVLTLPLDRGLAAAVTRSSYRMRLRISNLGPTNQLDRQCLARARGWMAHVIHGAESTTRFPLEKTWVIMPPGHGVRITKACSRSDAISPDHDGSSPENCRSTVTTAAVSEWRIEPVPSEDRLIHTDALSRTSTFVPDAELVLSRAIYMLDSILLAHEASQDLLEGIVQPQWMLRAISAPSSTLDLEHAYESLEFHGDTILSFVSAWEEYFRDIGRAGAPRPCKRKREMEIGPPVAELQTNRYLARAAEVSGIARYIRTQPFTKRYIRDSRSADLQGHRNGCPAREKVSRLYPPDQPGMPCGSVHPCYLTFVQTRADVVEATIAAAFMSDHGSFRSIIRVSRSLGIAMRHLDELETSIGRSACLAPPNSMRRATSDPLGPPDQASGLLDRPLDLDGNLLRVSRCQWA